MRVIQARAHGWKGKGAFSGVSEGKAKDMAAEGTRAPIEPKARKRVADALRKA